MKITVKRRHILDALRYNHLIAGVWFEPNYEYNSEAFRNLVKPNCTACLVGSTIRRAVKEKPTTVGMFNRLSEWISTVTQGNVIGIPGYEGEETFESAEQAINEEDYLTALSRKFESTMRFKAANKFGVEVENVSEEHLRQVKLTKKENAKLRQWVLDNIPVEFTVDDKRQKRSIE